MIRHLVIFHLEGFSSEEAKQQQLHHIKTSLEALPTEIDALQSLSVSFNANPDEPQTFILEAMVSDWDALREYSQHPLHVRIVKEQINPYRQGRVAIDIEE